MLSLFRTRPRSSAAYALVFTTGIAGQVAYSEAQIHKLKSQTELSTRDAHRVMKPLTEVRLTSDLSLVGYHGALFSSVLVLPKHKDELAFYLTLRSLTQFHAYRAASQQVIEPMLWGSSCLAVYLMPGLGLAYAGLCLGLNSVYHDYLERNIDCVTNIDAADVELEAARSHFFTQSLKGSRDFDLSPYERFKLIDLELKQRRKAQEE
jgi:hypothetical protein